jgi:hypothetical protein
MNNFHQAGTALQSRWSAGFCPAIDGIVKQSGEIYEVDIDVFDVGHELEFRLRAVTLLRITDWSTDQDFEWLEISEMYEVSDFIHDMCVGCGETSEGSRGFVAVSRQSDGQLDWLATFHHSNPFHKCHIDEGDVVAWSTHGTVWRFPLAHPEKITIEKQIAF